MTLTLEVSGEIAKQLALLPEGEPRNKEAVEWLRQIAEENAMMDRVANAPMTEKEAKMLEQGMVDNQAGRYRTLAQSFADSKARREQERRERDAT